MTNGNDAPTGQNASVLNFPEIPETLQLGNSTHFPVKEYKCSEHAPDLY